MLTVKAKTLDDFCELKSISAIDLLKVDAEGFECEVFRGGRECCLQKKLN
ncbi:FkbM family methyltransferase [Spiribacter salinus]